MISYRDCLTLHKKYSSISHDHKINIAVGGNCNLEFLRPSLTVGLHDNDVGSDLFFIDYDSWISYSLSHNNRHDFWVIWVSSFAITRGMTKTPEVSIETISKQVKFIHDQGSKIIFLLPELLPSLVDEYNPINLEINRLRKSLVESISNYATIVDPAIIQAKIGMEGWTAERYWETAKIPCSPDALTTIGYHVSHVISRMIRPIVKAIAIDLDNTLWGGVVGDDGVENLSLDPNGSGLAFLQMQYFLKNLSQRGIPLCVVSKNDEATALSPFSLREEMILKREDFIYFYASWDNKYKAVEKIASNLNIGINSICFIDDSIHERSEMRRFLPNVITPELSESPIDRVKQLYSSGLFFIPKSSKEDLRRSEMYKENEMRKSAEKNNSTIEDYLKSLELKVNIIPVDNINLPRVTELVNKTNQFNVTTRRYTQQTLFEFINQKDCFFFCYSASDKYGDLGIISVLLGKIHNSVITIDTWVLSCRAFNLKIEYAIASHLNKWGQERKCKSIEANYIPTSKNGVVANIFETLGLQCVESDQNGAKKYKGNLNPPEFYISIS